MNSLCSICLEIITNRTPIYVTPCGHLYHENCIKNCLQKISHGKCPQCTKHVEISQLIRLHINEPETPNKSKDELNIFQVEKSRIPLYDHLVNALQQQIDLQEELREMERNRCDCQTLAWERHQSKGGRKRRKNVQVSTPCKKINFSNQPFSFEDRPFGAIQTVSLKASSIFSGGADSNLTNFKFALPNLSNTVSEACETSTTQQPIGPTLYSTKLHNSSNTASEGYKTTIQQPIEPTLCTTKHHICDDLNGGEQLLSENDSNHQINCED